MTTETGPPRQASTPCLWSGLLMSGRKEHHGHPQWADHRKCDGSLVSVAAGGAFDHNEDGPLSHVEAFEESHMATTETRPDLADTETGERDGSAHYARKEEITRAAIEGGT